jgi:predicted small secreted protein
MRDTIRRYRLVTLAAVLLAMPLTACETKVLSVQLQGYGEDGAIEGLWLWRQSATGGYERVCRIDFLGIHENAGVEKLRYVQNCLDDHLGLELRADIERVANDPSTVVVHLWYMRWEDPGSYRGSAFNAAGESELSASTVAL